jgi:hypothetical protein
MITINFDKAKDITKARLRRERTELLQAQDVAFQRALESGADTTTIVAEKQRLRDITNAVDAVATLDELKAITVG